MLKELNRRLLLARRRKAAWERWQRKRPHNRVWRPRLRDDSGRVIGHGPPTPLPEPELPALFCRKIELPSGRREVVLSHSVIEMAYRMARYPKASPEEVEALPIREEKVRALYEECCRE